MNELVQAFVLGNAAILTNVCMLPLYPGLIAYMAGTVQSSSQRISPWLGIPVLAGVLSMMLGIGGLLYLLQASFSSVLPWLLPLIYLAVVVFGALMLMGRNPLRTLTAVQTPLARNPYWSAFSYGLFLGPMTLPCTGPLVVSAFLLGSGSAQALGSSLLYFLAFGLGFGWPLVLLPLLAHPFQQRFIRWTTRHHRLLTSASGILLVAIGLFGFGTEVLPNLGIL